MERAELAADEVEGIALIPVPGRVDLVVRLKLVAEQRDGELAGQDGLAALAAELAIGPPEPRHFEIPGLRRDEGGLAADAELDEQPRPRPARHRIHGPIDAFLDTQPSHQSAALM